MISVSIFNSEKNELQMEKIRQPFPSFFAQKKTELKNLTPFQN